MITVNYLLILHAYYLHIKDICFFPLLLFLFLSHSFHLLFLLSLFFPYLSLFPFLSYFLSLFSFLIYSLFFPLLFRLFLNSLFLFLSSLILPVTIRYSFLLLIFQSILSVFQKELHQDCIQLVYLLNHLDMLLIYVHEQSLKDFEEQMHLAFEVFFCLCYL